MPDTLIEAAATMPEQRDQRFFGVALATVVDNIDILGTGRVQVHLPWYPELEPWCRVAVLSGGSDRGTFFIPQVDDEVVVAFEHGDIRSPFVIGSVWSASDQPPATEPTDPVSKRMIKTPAGHTVELDDLEQTVAVKTSTGQKITLGPDSIELSAGDGAAKVTLETAGTITIQASTQLELKAPSISIEGTSVDVKGSASATIDGGGSCTIKGGLVSIN